MSPFPNGGSETGLQNATQPPVFSITPPKTNMGLEKVTPLKMAFFGYLC